MNSLYQKTCPRCAADHPVRTTTCACGYRFDASDNGDEERLFAEYLAARAKQTAEAAIVAEARRKAAPHDPRAAADAIAAIHEAEEARKMLTEQLDRINASAARVVVPAATPATVTTRAERVPEKREPVAPVPSATRTARTPSAHSATLGVSATPPSKPQPASPRAPVASNPKALAPRVAPAPRLLTASPSASMQSCPVCSASVPAGRAVCGCGYSLAPPDLPSLGEALPSPIAVAKPKVTKAETPEIAGKVRLAREAERVAQRLTLKDKTCPHCTAQVPGDAKECGCGFLFVEPTQLMPSLGLDPSDQAVLDSLAKKPK